MAEFLLGVLVGMAFMRFKTNLIGLFKRAETTIEKGINNSLK